MVFSGGLTSRYFFLLERGHDFRNPEDRTLSAGREGEKAALINIGPVKNSYITGS